MRSINEVEQVDINDNEVDSSNSFETSFVASDSEKRVEADVDKKRAIVSDLWLDSKGTDGVPSMKSEVKYEKSGHELTPNDIPNRITDQMSDPNSEKNG